MMTEPDEVTEEDYEPPCGDPQCHELHCARCNDHVGMMGHINGCPPRGSGH